MIVLDTHAWLWALSKPSELSASASEALDDSTTVAVSAISIWEVAMLVQRDRIRMSQPVPAFMQAVFAQDRRFREVPVDGAIAIEAINLKSEGLTGDPADQMILATAKRLGAKLVTKDRQLREFAPDLTIW